MTKPKSFVYDIFSPFLKCHTIILSFYTRRYSRQIAHKFMGILAYDINHVVFTCPFVRIRVQNGPVFRAVRSKTKLIGSSPGSDLGILYRNRRFCVFTTLCKVIYKTVQPITTSQRSRK